MRPLGRARTNWVFWTALPVLFFWSASRCFPQSGTPVQHVGKPAYGVALSASLPAPATNPASSYLIDVYRLIAPRSQTGETPQTITIGAIKNHSLGDPPFKVHATSDSNLPVTLTVKRGPATISGSVVTLIDQGTVEIEATQGGNGKYRPAPPKTVRFQVVDGHNYDYCVPGLLPPESWKRSLQQPNKTGLASRIIPLLGSPSPFSFGALGDQEILIYSSRYPLKAADKAKLAEIKVAITKLLTAPGVATARANSANSPPTNAPSSQEASTAYSLEVRVPHADELGDLANAISELNSSMFKVQDAGPNKILITSTSVPTCRVITQFLNDIRALAWQPHQVSPVAQIFHLSASDVTGAFTGVTAPSGTGAGPSTSPTAPTTAPATPSNGPSTATTADGVASSANSSPASASSAAGTAPNQPPAAGGNMATPSVPAVAPQPKVSAINPDLLLFSESVPGGDAAVEQQKRILALLDLPRPDVIINAWSMQESTTDREAVGQFNGMLSETVKSYNDGLQQAILRGWAYLNDQIQRNSRSYFNQGFYDYVVRRYVAEPIDRNTLSLGSPSQVADAILDMRLGPVLGSTRRKDYGICQANTYCLGYTTIFRPLQPTLTHLLLAILAANDPGYQASEAIDHAEQGNYLRAPESCEDMDKRGEQGYSSSSHPPLFLECFRQETKALLCNNNHSPGRCPANSGDTPFVRQARGAIADFLFNYKMAQQYPHQFEPYELGVSAQKLNSVLSPFIDAFNRDISTYQGFLRGKIQQQAEAKYKRSRIFLKRWLGVDKQTFVNDGIVTVRTLSTATATVNTTTQNFLDATQQPSVAALLSSIENASHPAASTTGHMTDLLQNISPIQAQVLVGALNAMQSSEIQIGKSLDVTLTPRSLNGASAAEINVTLKADDVASPTYYAPSQSSATNADVSRVATHDTTTTVRVDSLKLFDISSFSATLQRARPRFPLIPPFVELPYIGTVAGVPLPAVKEYHTSTAVLSAIVVPTATDIAYGLSFVMDRVVDASHAAACHWPGAPSADKTSHPYLCSLRKAESISDLGGEPVTDFNKAMVTCLATGYIPGDSGDPSSLDPCSHLTVDEVFHERP